VRANEYDFDTQMAMSNGVHEVASVESIILKHIPGSLSVKRAAAINDRSGTDYWIEMQGRHLSVDAKVRYEDWWASHPKEDDLALETWSVVDKKIGWTRDTNKQTDYVLWLWKDTKRFCLLPFPCLCAVFIANWEKWRNDCGFKVKEQFTHSYNGGWRSECVFVPRRLIWAEIYKRYSPDLITRS